MCTVKGLVFEMWLVGIRDQRLTIKVAQGFGIRV